MIKNYPAKSIHLFYKKQRGGILLLNSLLAFSAAAFTQAVKAPLVVLSQSGETTYIPANGFDYSHYTNYTLNITDITTKWILNTLMDEPIVDTVFK